MGKLAGKLAVRDDNLYLEALRINTAETTLAIDGVIEKYLQTPVVKLTTTGNVSLPEIGRVVPPVAPYRLHPVVDIKANGPAERLALDLDVKSEAGNARGQLTADVAGPAMGAEGELQVERLNLAEILNNPEQRSDITGRARVDLEVAGAPASAPVAERLSGTFAFAGPRVVAAGYSATNVDVKGRIDGPRIQLDGRARAYGGTATAQGFIVTPSERRALSFDLRGRAANVNLQNLPASTGVPELSTNLDLASYHVRGAGGDISGTAELNRSTVEGATVEAGTVAEFSLQPGAISYSARGGVVDLDVERMGKALDIPAIAKAEYASRVNGTFDVTGSMPRRPPGRAADRLIDRDDDARRDRTAERLRNHGWPPAGSCLRSASRRRRSQRQARWPVRRVRSSPARVATGSQGRGDRHDQCQRVGGRPHGADYTRGRHRRRDADACEIDGGWTRNRDGEPRRRYANQVGDVKQFTLTGPDVKVDASGRVALDRTTASNLKYHVEAIDLPELAKLAGQAQPEIGGTAVIDGTITGNRASLSTTGTLNGSNLSYQENSALDLNSTYTVTIPELEFAKAKVDATTKGTFIKAGAFEITELTAKTVYDQQTVAFSTNVKEKTRELDATGRVILHPDHQELHLPTLAVRTNGVEWTIKPGTEATVKYSPERIELVGVELVSADQALSVNGTVALKGEVPSAALDVVAQRVDLQQLETLLLQDRGFVGKLDAKARVTGTMEAPTVDGHVEIHGGAFRNYKYESLIADVDYAGRRATVDATLQQTATERDHGEGLGSGLAVLGEPDRRARRCGSAKTPSTCTSSRQHSGSGSSRDSPTCWRTSPARSKQMFDVTGSGQDPHLQGHIDIRNGAFGVPARRRVVFRPQHAGST